MENATDSEKTAMAEEMALNNLFLVRRADPAFVLLKHGLQFLDGLIARLCFFSFLGFFR
jgi:hypothetical protein